MLKGTFRCLMTSKNRQPTFRSYFSWTDLVTCERMITRSTKMTLMMPSYSSFFTRKLMTKLKTKKQKHRFKKKSQQKKRKVQQNGRARLAPFWTRCPFQFVTFAPRDRDQVYRNLLHNGLPPKWYLKMKQGRRKNLKAKVLKRFLWTWLVSRCLLETSGTWFLTTRDAKYCKSWKQIRPRKLKKPRSSNLLRKSWPSRFQRRYKQQRLKKNHRHHRHSLKLKKSNRRYLKKRKKDQTLLRSKLIGSTMMMTAAV